MGAEQGAGAAPRGDVPSGWRLTFGAAAASLALAALGCLLALVPGRVGPEFAGGVLLFGAGHTLLRGAVCFGVARRARWALGLGAALALLSLLAPALATARLETNAGVFESTPEAVALGWGQFVAAVVFLAGACRLRRGR